MANVAILVDEDGLLALAIYNDQGFITPARKKRMLGQAFQTDSEPYQAGELDLLPCRGNRSRIWKGIKRSYNHLPGFLRGPFTLAIMAPYEVLSMLSATAQLHPMSYVRSWTHYHSNRGMSRWHDVVDWIGGYPFEVAKPDECFRFYRDRGFCLENVTTKGGSHGNNQYLFRREVQR